MAIYTYPLFGDELEPDPGKHGICRACGDLTDHPSAQVCDDCGDHDELDDLPQG